MRHLFSFLTLGSILVQGFVQETCGVLPPIPLYDSNNQNAQTTTNATKPLSPKQRILQDLMSTAQSRRSLQNISPRKAEEFFFNAETE